MMEYFKKTREITMLGSFDPFNGGISQCWDHEMHKGIGWILGNHAISCQIAQSTSRSPSIAPILQTLYPGQGYCIRTKQCDEKTYANCYLHTNPISITISITISWFFHHFSPMTPIFLKQKRNQPKHVAEPAPLPAVLIFSRISSPT